MTLDRLLRPLPPTVRRYLREVLDDRLLGLAAETAFFTVLSVFPGLLVLASLLGLLEPLVGARLAEQAQEQVVRALSLVLTDQAAGLLDSVRSLFADNRGGLLTAATAGALVSLSGAFAVAVGGLNLAHDVVETRPWWRRRLLGLAMAASTVVLATLVLAAVVVGPLLGQGRRVADLVGLGDTFATAWDLARLPAVALVLVLWVTALLHLAPNRRLPWRAAVPGAVLTVGLGLVASVGFRLYAGFAVQRNPVLGVFGGGAILMTWVYLLSLSLLLGGELNAVLVQRRERADARQLALFDP